MPKPFSCAGMSALPSRDAPTLDLMDLGAHGRRVPFLPMVVEEEFEQERVVAAYGAFGELILLGSAGVATSNREPMIVVAAEVPSLVRSPMTKAEQELNDLLDFARREVPTVRAEALVPGPEPNSAPDALLELQTSVVRLEAAQLHVPATSALGTNMHRWAIFDQIRSSLISESAILASALRRHRGTIVYVWFMDPGEGDSQFSLPPRKAPAKALVELLHGSRPSATLPGTMNRLATPAPDAVAWSADASVGASWGDLPTGYRSPFVQALGFELGLGGSVSFKRSHVRAELRRIVEQHDRAASDVLVVSTNSALRSGLHFPSTQLASELLFADPDPLQGWVPNHLRGVAIHDPREGHAVRWLVGQLA
jgi:hypothetical protein